MSIEERVHAAEEIRSQYMEPLEELDAWQRFNMPAIDRADRRLLYHGWFMNTELTVVQQYWWDNLLVDRNALLRQLALPVLDVQLYGSRSASSAASRSRYEEGASALGLGDNYRVVFHYGVGHFLMEDAPELLDEIIAGFVALGSRIQR